MNISYKSIKDLGYEIIIKFLKIDYANNLYFFTYLNAAEVQNPENKMLVGEIDGDIVILILLTPAHCSISSLNMEYIDLIAKQLPPLNSMHVVGRSDYVEKLLLVSEGPERTRHDYTLCELPVGIPYHNPVSLSTRASHADLRELVQFYSNNDMLYDAKNRLPGILNWGRVHYSRHNGQIVSCALTTTETEDAAMIGAVFTNPEYRKRGYARACLMSLGQELLKQNKTPYLFYETGDLLLKRFYGALGFRKIGDWVLATRTVV